MSELLKAHKSCCSSNILQLIHPMFFASCSTPKSLACFITLSQEPGRSSFQGILRPMQAAASGGSKAGCKEDMTYQFNPVPTVPIAGYFVTNVTLW